MENVSVIKAYGKKIYLLATAHVSEKSASQAKELIESVKPDSVTVELDEERLNNLLHPKSWDDTDITKIIKDKKAAFLLVSLILSSYQKRIGDKVGCVPGNEMLVSALYAKENNINIVTADRNIRTTFLRIWRKIGFGAKIKLIINLVFGLTQDEDISKEDIENLKDKDMLEAALGELGGEFPSLKSVLVDERDLYIANKIITAPGTVIVAVVGAAHSPGVKKLIEQGECSAPPELDEIPPAKPVGKIIAWAIPALILFMLLYTLLKDPSALLMQIGKWILYNGSLALIGTLIAGGNIISALVAFVAAPITSLNPLLAAGWFAGLAEAKINKPTVMDFKGLSEDLKSFKSMRKNRVIRILLVVVFANIGSTIGTFLGGVGIFNIFKKFVH